MIYKKLVVLTLGLALIAAHLAGCTSIQADELQWETDGGGQITFSVRRNDPGFDVQVTSYRFDDRDDRFTITPDAGEVYAALVRVMQDQRRIRRSLSLPGLTEGTWTTLASEQMKVFTRTFDFLTWLLPATNSFPRAHRHTFTQRLLDAAFDFQERIEEGNARKGRARLAQLERADEALGKVRIYIRLAARWKWLSEGQYAHAARANSTGPAPWDCGPWRRANL